MLTYIKVLPANYTPSENIPLIAFLPGHKGTYTKFKSMFALEQKNRRFIGLYFSTPVGGWNMSDHRAEIMSILNTNASANKQFCIIGVSNGACFGMQLQSLKLVENVAAFAGSLFDTDTVLPSVTRRLMMFNGKTDRSMPYNGGSAHKVNMLGAVKTFEAMSKGKPLASILRNNQQKYDYYSTYDQTIRLYGFDLYGHDVYPLVSKELKWNLPDMCLNFFGIAKSTVK